MPNLSPSERKTWRHTGLFGILVAISFFVYLISVPTLFEIAAYSPDDILEGKLSEEQLTNPQPSQMPWMMFQQLVFVMPSSVLTGLFLLLIANLFVLAEQRILKQLAQALALVAAFLGILGSLFLLVLRLSADAVSEFQLLWWSGYLALLLFYIFTFISFFIIFIGAYQNGSIPPKLCLVGMLGCAIGGWACIQSTNPHNITANFASSMVGAVLLTGICAYILWISEAKTTDLLASEVTIQVIDANKTL